MTTAVSATNVKSKPISLYDEPICNLRSELELKQGTRTFVVTNGLSLYALATGHWRFLIFSSRIIVNMFRSSSLRNLIRQLIFAYRCDHFDLLDLDLPGLDLLEPLDLCDFCDFADFCDFDDFCDFVDFSDSSDFCDFGDFFDFDFCDFCDF